MFDSHIKKSMKEYQLDSINEESFDVKDAFWESFTRAYHSMPQEVKDDFWESRFNDGDISDVYMYKKEVVGFIVASTKPSEIDEKRFDCHIYGIGSINDEMTTRILKSFIGSVFSKRKKPLGRRSGNQKYKLITANAENETQQQLLESFGFVKADDSTLMVKVLR